MHPQTRPAAVSREASSGSVLHPAGTAMGCTRATASSRRRAVLLGLLGMIVLGSCGSRSPATGRRLQASFGFEYGTPYVGDRHCFMEVLSISHVAPGGSFDLAGVRSGDILTPGSHRGILGLYDQLDQLKPGESLELLVRTPEKVGCWSDWPERAAVVVAP